MPTCPINNESAELAQSLKVLLIYNKCRRSSYIFQDPVTQPLNYLGTISCSPEQLSQASHRTRTLGSLEAISI